MSEITGPLIKRVLSLELNHFKGFQDPPPDPEDRLDLNADIVLLTGPNGYGKSSVIEALEVLFTGGWIDRRQPPARSSARQQKMDWGPLVNEHADEARLRADVACPYCVPEACPVEITLRRTESSSRSTLQDLAKKVGWGDLGLEDQNRRRMLRDPAFFYQDGLNAFLGLAEEARQQIVDYLVPAPSFFSAVQGPAGRLAAEARRRLRGATSLRERSEIEDESALAAKALHDAANRGEETTRFKIVGVAGNLLAERSVRMALRGLAEYAGIATAEVEAIGDDRATWERGLEQIEHAARQKAASARKVRAGGPRSGQAPAWLKGLTPDAESPAMLQMRMRELGTREVLEAQGQALEQERRALAALRDLLSRRLEDPARHGGEVGLLPLLRSALELREGQAAPLGRLGETHPRLAGTAQEIVLAAPLEEMRAALHEAEALREEADERARVVDLELRRNRDALAARAALEAQLDRCREIQDWLTARKPGCRLEESYVSREDPTKLDVDALKREATERFEDSASDEATKWDAVAEAAGRWRVLEEELQQAIREAAESQRARLRCFVALTDKLAQPDFGTAVRAALIDEGHSKALNDAVRRILSRFAVHYYLRRNLSTRLSLGGGLTTLLPEVKDKGSRVWERDERSLSTGQLNALCVAISMVFSLQRPDNPLGFVCLDDVSSAFDLDNLACDAAVIRALAYAEDERQRRQVILATHHDELTARLMPLLRPPRGHTLKVIQFRDWSRTNGPEIRQWECIAGGADPGAVIKLWGMRCGEAPVGAGGKH